MKKVLSLFLALCMALSLCACGDKSGGDASNNPPDVSSGQNEVESTEGQKSDAPKPVTGDRVQVEGTDPTVTATPLPTSWTEGPVDISELMRPERMPLDKGKVKFVMSGEVQQEDIDGAFGVSMYMNDGEFDSMEFSGVRDGMQMSTSMFERDGETYLYVKAFGTGDEDGEMLYHISSDEIDASGEESGEPVDGEETGEPVDGEEGITTESGDGLVIDPDEVTSGLDGLNMDDFDAEKYKSCEYVGLVGEDDTFKIVDVDNQEFLLLVSHKTGLITGMNITSAVGEGEEMQMTAVRIYYGSEAESGIGDMDLTDVEEMDAFSAIFTLMAPMLIFMDMEG